MRRSKIAFKPKIGISKSEVIEPALKDKENDKSLLLISNEANEFVEPANENIERIDNCKSQNVATPSTTCSSTLENTQTADLTDFSQNIVEIVSEGQLLRQQNLNLDQLVINIEDQHDTQNDPIENNANKIFDQLVTDLISLSQTNRSQNHVDLGNQRPYILNREDVAKSWNTKPTKSKTDYNEPLLDSLRDEDYNESGLTMKDLVFKNPQANPMKSPAKTVVSSEPVDKQISQNATSGPDVDSPAQPSPLPTPQQTLAPKVKIGPDGNIIIDSESLYVPNPSQNDEIFSKPAIQEDYDPFSYLRYFKKSANHKIWSREENIKFYKALGKHGINLTSITQEFPSRQRIEIKKKFKREEKINGNMIDIALAQNPKLDYFLSVLYPVKNGSATDPKNNRKRVNQHDRPRNKGEVGSEEDVDDEYSLISEHTSDEEDTISLNSSQTETSSLKRQKSSVNNKKSKDLAGETTIKKPLGTYENLRVTTVGGNNGRKKRVKHNNIVLTKNQYDTANSLLQQITGNKIKDLASFIPPTFDKKAGFIQNLFGPYQSDPTNLITPDYSHALNVATEETVVSHDQDTSTDTLSVLEQNITSAIQEGLAQDNSLEENIASGQVLLLPQQYYIKNQIYQVYLVPVPSTSNVNQSGNDIT